MAANLGEGPHNHVPPSAVTPNGPPAQAINPLPKYAAPAQDGETDDDDDDDDDLDEYRDFGSGWRGLGIGRLLVLALLLALLIPPVFGCLMGRSEKSRNNWFALNLKPPPAKVWGPATALHKKNPCSKRNALQLPSHRNRLVTCQHRPRGQPHLRLKLRLKSRSHRRGTPRQRLQRRVPPKLAVNEA